VKHSLLRRGGARKEKVHERGKNYRARDRVHRGLGAAWIAKKIVSGPREVQQVEKTVGATDVLVAARNIGLT
jgi:hypothetical protein